MAISKKLRFEILRRDNFTCRYCGKCAPDTELEVDHLIAVANGGDDDYFNLLTACFDCNRGKGKRRLDDDSITKGHKETLDKLSSNLAEQAEILRQREDTQQQEANIGRRVREMWEHKTGERLPHAWNTVISRWIKAFSLSVVIDALVEVVRRSHRFDAVLSERKRPSAIIFDVPRYAAVMSADEREPGTRQCYFLRGRILKKFADAGLDANVLLANLVVEMRNGTSFEQMHQWVSEAEYLDDVLQHFSGTREEYEESFAGDSFAPQSNPSTVFIREDQPEWRAWQDHLRATTGKGSPMNKRFGWNFPSQWPPEQRAAI